jgi:hypothetical protein
MPVLAWTETLLFVLPHIAGDDWCVPPHQPLVEMGFHELTTWAILEPWSSLSLPPE